MSQSNVTRRDFVKTSAVAASAMAAPMIIPRSAFGANDRITVGFVGTGSRGMSHVNGVTGLKDVEAVAACDVDSKHLERAKGTIVQKNKRMGRKTEIATYSKYEELIARNDIDAVVCTTPDHWHTKIVIEAMKAGKDIYCEKPLTLTIEEGQQIVNVTKKTKRIFQVGTQQRSGRQFLNTVAFIRNGGLGKVSKVQCAIGGAPKGGPFPVEKAPGNLDWDRWQGQTSEVDYRKRRCHYEFRWWYEYSGGKMTDWGAHHVDIASWALGLEKTGPNTVGGTSSHPVPFKDGYPTKDDSYNTATAFNVKAMFDSQQHGDIEMTIRHDTKNGITFTGEKGQIYVSRSGKTGTLNGKHPSVSKEHLAETYKYDMSPNHYANWVNCIRDRKEPVSDVFSHHRHISTCHLANMAIRLNQTIKWDPVKEAVIGNDKAQAMVGRKQRAGYEIKV